VARIFRRGDRELQGCNDDVNTAVQGICILWYPGYFKTYCWNKQRRFQSRRPYSFNIQGTE
jgi:hypothetical protein